MVGGRAGLRRPCLLHRFEEGRLGWGLSLARDPWQLDVAGAVGEDEGVLASALAVVTAAVGAVVVDDLGNVDHQATFSVQCSYFLVGACVCAT